MGFRNFFTKKNKLEYEYLQELFGTKCFIKAYGENAKQAVEESFKRLKELNDKFSIFDIKSEISDFNNCEDEIFSASDDMRYLIKKSKEYSKITQGYFDITSQVLIEKWNVGKKNFKVLDKSEVEKICENIDYTKLEVLDDLHSIKKYKEQKISFAAIAKGYATDEVAGIMKKYEVDSAVINLGGNIFVLGYKQDSQPWGVGIQNPFENTGVYMGAISLVNKSVVTSGSYERFSTLNGVVYSHIIDIQTGYPVENEMLGISVVSDKSIDGDGLSTGLFVLGHERAIEIVEKIEGVECICILKNKKVVVSKGLVGKFVITDERFYF